MRDFPRDAGFVEVGDRCWVARFAFLDLTVGLVGGERGLLLVDTHTSEAALRRLLGEVRALGAGEVVAAVNTHHHFDHVLGNRALREEYAGLPVHAHDSVPDSMAAALPAVLAEAADEADPGYAEVAASRPDAPDRLLSSVRAVDLGDRVVELVHPGRGHTAGDVVARVGDADVLFAGDLVEESAERQATPGFGADCFPLEWPGTLDLVIGMLGPGAVVVPGHGRPVGRDFVADQRDDVGTVAETIRELAGTGVPAAEALAAADWPFPVEHLAEAVRRGYAQLPRGSRSLPLA